MKNKLLTFLTIIAVAFAAYAYGNTQFVSSADPNYTEHIVSHTATSTSDGKYIEDDNAFFLNPFVDLFDEQGNFKATTTLEVDVDGFNKASLGLFMVSSSTPSNISTSTISIGFQLSYDGKGWYDYIPTINTVNTSNASVLTDAFYLATNTPAYTWAPNLNTADKGTSTPIFDFLIPATKKMRILIGAGGATSSVRAEIMLKQ